MLQKANTVPKQPYFLNNKKNNCNFNFLSFVTTIRIEIIKPIKTFFKTSLLILAIEKEFKQRRLLVESIKYTKQSQPGFYMQESTLTKEN